MQKNELIELMIGLAVDALEEEGVEEPMQVNRDSPLFGSESILNSMGLVTLITGVESMLAEEHQIDVTLVSEDAFSRRWSPFRTIDALADYILELSGARRTMPWKPLANRQAIHERRVEPSGTGDRSQQGNR